MKRVTEDFCSEICRLISFAQEEISFEYLFSSCDAVSTLWSETNVVKSSAYDVWRFVADG